MVAMDQQSLLNREIAGKKERYVIRKWLQSALFGGVYEARGTISQRDYAVKQLNKKMLWNASKAQGESSAPADFAERFFAPKMEGHKNVLAPHEIVEDSEAYYVVSDLARGGDLLEALKTKPTGFSEQEARDLIRQSCEGLRHLHSRNMALQDMSLENLLLFVTETGAYNVKICDPGQAADFTRDENGREKKTGFKGLVGKSFRPPELYERDPYYSSKVDSWCLGWSCFYLLTAHSLFQAADPTQPEVDADFIRFREGKVSKFIRDRQIRISDDAVDFVLRLMELDPQRRMSPEEALSHKWLRGAARPMIASQQLILAERNARQRADMKRPILESQGARGRQRERPRSRAPPGVSPAPPEAAPVPDAPVRNGPQGTLRSVRARSPQSSPRLSSPLVEAGSSARARAASPQVQSQRVRGMPPPSTSPYGGNGDAATPSSTRRQPLLASASRVSAEDPRVPRSNTAVGSLQAQVPSAPESARLSGSAGTRSSVALYRFDPGEDSPPVPGRLTRQVPGWHSPGPMNGPQGVQPRSPQPTPRVGMGARVVAPNEPAAATRAPSPSAAGLADRNPRVRAFSPPPVASYVQPQAAIRSPSPPVPTFPGMGQARQPLVWRSPSPVGARSPSPAPLGQSSPRFSAQPLAGPYGLPAYPPAAAVRALSPSAVSSQPLGGSSVRTLSPSVRLSQGMATTPGALRWDAPRVQPESRLQPTRPPRYSFMG